MKIPLRRLKVKDNLHPQKNTLSGDFNYLNQDSLSILSLLGRLRLLITDGVL